MVDRQQVHRTISKEEMLHLFEFGDDESSDIPLELKQAREHAGEANTTVDVGSVSKQKLTFPNGSSTSDKLMQSLIDSHHPRYDVLFLLRHINNFFGTYILSFSVSFFFLLINFTFIFLPF